MGSCKSKSKKSLENSKKPSSPLSIRTKFDIGDKSKKTKEIKLNVKSVDENPSPIMIPSVPFIPIINRCEDLISIQKNNEIIKAKFTNNLTDQSINNIKQKEKLSLIKSKIKVGENKDTRFLELILKYNNLYEFSVVIRFENDNNRSEWEFEKIIELDSKQKIYYRVRDKLDRVGNMEIIQFENEDELIIKEMAYTIFLIDKIKFSKNNKKSLNQNSQCNILGIIDYYIFAESFQYSFHPKKYLYIIWETFDSSLKMIIDERNKNGNLYSNKELLYISKSLFSGLQTLKDAKIIHRNIKPKNIVYDSISQTYSITNFKYSKLKNSHKLIKNYENDEKEEKEEDHKYQNELNRRYYLKKLSLAQHPSPLLRTENRFNHTIVGTPYYMIPQMLDAYEEGRYQLKYTENIYNIDNYSIAKTILELNYLTKIDDLEQIKNDIINETVPSGPLKPIILKIIDDSIDLHYFMIKPKNESPESGYSKSKYHSPSDSFKKIQKKLGIFRLMNKKGLENLEIHFIKMFCVDRKRRIELILNFLKEYPDEIPNESQFINIEKEEEKTNIDFIEEKKELGNFFLLIGNPNKSLQYFQDAKKWIDPIDNPLLCLENFRDYALAYFQTGKYGFALKTIVEAKSLKIPNSTEEIKTLKLEIMSLDSLIYKNKGEYNIAIKICHKVINKIEKSEFKNISFELAVLKEHLSELYFLIDKNYDALTNIQSALSLYRDIEYNEYSSLQLADALLFASQIYKNLMENEKSEAFLREAYIIYTSRYKEDNPVVGYICLQLSLIAKEREEIEESINFAEKALRILNIYYNDYDESLMQAVKILSSLYRDDNDIDKAIDLLKLYLSKINLLGKELEEPHIVAENLKILGELYQQTQNFELSKKSYVEAITIYNNYLLEDDLILNDLLFKLGNLDREYILTNKNNNIINTKNPSNINNNLLYRDGSLANSLINLGDIKLYKGEYEKSLKLYLQALSYKKNGNYFDDNYTELHFKIGLIFLIASKFDDSLKYFTECSTLMMENIKKGAENQVFKVLLIIGSIYLIIDQKKESIDFFDKIEKMIINQSENIETNLLSISKEIILNQRNKNHIDKHNLLNQIFSLLQISFENTLNLTTTERSTLQLGLNSIQSSTRKFLETTPLNLQSEKNIFKKINSFNIDVSLNIPLSHPVRAFSLKSPHSFTSSIKDKSLNLLSVGTPRFRGDSMVFKKKTFCVINSEKYDELLDSGREERKKMSIEFKDDLKNIKLEKSFNDIHKVDEVEDEEYKSVASPLKRVKK